MHGGDFCAMGNQDAVDGLDNVVRQRNKVKITGRLSTANDGSESEIVFLIVC